LNNGNNIYGHTIWNTKLNSTINIILIQVAPSSINIYVHCTVTPQKQVKIPQEKKKRIASRNKPFMKMKRNIANNNPFNKTSKVSLHDSPDLMQQHLHQQLKEYETAIYIWQCVLIKQEADKR